LCFEQELEDISNALGMKWLSLLLWFGLPLAFFIAVQSPDISNGCCFPVLFHFLLSGLVKQKPLARSSFSNCTSSPWWSS
jgi:hypothetical protein